MLIKAIIFVCDERCVVVLTLCVCMCTGTGHLVQLEMRCCSHCLCMYVYRDGALGAACRDVLLTHCVCMCTGTGAGALGAVRYVLLFSLSVYVCVQGRGTWCSL